MPALPAKSKISAPYPNPSNATAREGFGEVHDWANGLFGMSGDKATTLGVLGAVKKSGDTMTGELSAPTLRVGGGVSGRMNSYNASTVLVAETGVGVGTGFGDSYGINVANGTGQIVFSTNGTSRLEAQSSGNIKINSKLQVAGHTTTASAANCHIDAAGLIYRSTSSLQYKTSVEAVTEEYSRKVLDLRPIWYRSTLEADQPDWGWYSYAAEEAAAVDPTFATWGYENDDYIEIEKKESILVHDGQDVDGNPTTREEVIVRKEKVLRDGAEMKPNGINFNAVNVRVHSRLIHLETEVIPALLARIEALEAKA